MKISEIINELSELQQYIGDKNLEACIANDTTTGVNVMYENDDGGITSTSLEGEKMTHLIKETTSDQGALVKQQDREQFIKDSLMIELAKQDAENLKLAEERKAKITYTAVIDDGITKRVVDVNTISDSLTPEIAMQVGKSFQTISVQTAKDRQAEIDKNSEYYKHERLKTESML